MAWYYYQNGANQGPVEASELQSLLQGNVISLDTPVWTEGMAQWEPYRSSTAAPATLATTTTQLCSQCGQSFPEEDMLSYEGSWVCAACKPVFFQRIKEGVAPHHVLNYAGIFPRFAAVFVDGLITIVVIMVPEFFLIGWQGLLKGTDVPIALNIGIMAINYLFPALYETFFIGKYGATPGKMALGIKVVSPDGGPISYGRALGRYFAKILSGMIIYIGYLMAFWDDEKRALHDRICKTRVVVDTAP
jgi:uncharacterized RDD family membrane protein YckC